MVTPNPCSSSSMTFAFLASGMSRCGSLPTLLFLSVFLLPPAWLFSSYYESRQYFLDRQS